MKESGLMINSLDMDSEDTSCLSATFMYLIRILICIYYLAFRSGNTYQGNWSECRRHGNGTMVWMDRGEKYIGEWKNGAQVINLQFWSLCIVMTS